MQHVLQQDQISKKAKQSRGWMIRSVASDQREATLGRLDTHSFTPYSSIL
jgi:hypothetical protein